MNKSLIACATSAFFIGIAHAQSSVSLYGVLDGGITYTNSQQSTGVGRGGAGWQAGSGNLTPSRWGLRGREDLGDGNAAVFALENGFNLDNGRAGGAGTAMSTGLMFSRQAYVGVSGRSWGTLTAGRQYDPFSDTVGAYSSSNDWGGGFAAHFGDIDNLNQSLSLSNAVKYVTPSFNGLSASGLYSLGGQAGNFAQNRAWSLAAAYTAGPLSLGAGYLNLRNPLTGSGNSGAYSSGGAYQGALSTDYLGLQNARSEQIFGVGSAYTWGPATFNLAWTRTHLFSSQYFVPSGGAVSDIRFDNYEIGAKYLVSPVLTAGLSYVFTDGKTDYLGLRPQFHQINLGGNYLLSKQTVFYMVATYQRARGDGIVYNGSGLYVPVAATAGLSDSATGRQVTVTVGIKHSF